MPKEARDLPGRESLRSPVDKHVGSRIRLRRTLLGMSQERLGQSLHITFQQVQKYERGANRVSASRLFELSRVLDVSIIFFFDDMREGMDASAAPRGRRYGLPEEQKPFSSEEVDNFTKRETLELVRAYYRITNPAARKQMLHLMKSLAPAEPSFET